MVGLGLGVNPMESRSLCSGDAALAGYLREPLGTAKRDSSGVLIRPTPNSGLLRIYGFLYEKIESKD